MKNLKLRHAILLVAVLFTSSLFAQDWVKMMNDQNTNFYDVQNAFGKYYVKAERRAEREAKKLRKTQGENFSEGELEVPGYEQYKRWEYFMQSRVSPTGQRFDPSAVWNAMTKYREAYGTFAAGSWTLVGPTSPTVPSGGGGAGRTNFVTVHPTTPTTIWTGSPGGGLWKSTDGGSTWSTNTDNLAQVIGCTDLAIDPTTPNTMYLATGDAEGGDTYTVGLLKTTDGGATWNTTGLTRSMGQSQSIAKLLINPTTPSTIFVATSAGLYKSTDAGVTFTLSLNSSIKDIEFMPGTPNTMYACGNQFYKSTNGGSTWSAPYTTTFPTAVNCQRMAIAVTAANPAYVYAVTAKATTYDLEGFYISTNSGTSFTKLTVAPAALAAAGSGSLIGNQGFYALSLAVSPTTASEVIVGGLDVYRCATVPTSGTATFTRTSYWSGGSPYVHADIHELEYTNATSYYVCCDGGLFQTTNSGSAYTDKSNGLQISEMYGFGQSSTTAGTMISGWQDNGTNLYSGGSWSRPIGGDGMKAFVSWGNDQNMWGSIYNGQLEKSTNGGTSFSAATSGITDALNTWVTEWKEDPVTANTLYAGFANVWKSTNGGTAWTKPGTVGTGTVNIQAIGISPANNQVIWAAKGGTLYKTTNGGTAWTAITGLPPGNISGIACSYTDANKAWITYPGFSNNYKVYQTTNQGTSWTNLSGSIPNVPVNCITVDKNGNDALYIGTDGGVFFKDASTSVWQPFSGGLPTVVVTQLEIFYSGNKIRASTYGRGIWESGFYTAGAYAPTANFGSDRKIACPGAAIQFSDWTAGQPTSWSWTFSGGNPATSSVQNPLVSYNTQGTYPVSLTATNANGTDTKTYTSFITISNASVAPTTTGKNFCGPLAVTLSATHTTGTNRWWNAPGGGTLLFTGNTPFTTPVLNATTTYYVDETFPPLGTDITGAPNYTSVGAGAQFNANDIRGLYFDVTQPVTINSFDVYSYSAGARTIQILDSQGNSFYDTTITVTGSATPTAQTIPVKITIYPGTNYFIKWLGTCDFYRNNAGAVYPYSSTAVNITGSNAGSPGYYYFFYNWQYTMNSCNTGRTPCVALDSCATGIMDPIAGGAMNIFPNPNSGNFMLSFQTQNKDNYKIKITNTLGQLVYEENLNDFSGDYSRKMDVATFGKGVYMLSISNSKNETVKKVMVY